MPTTTTPEATMNDTYVPTQDYDFMCIIKVAGATLRVWVNAPSTDNVPFMLHNIYGVDVTIYDIIPEYRHDNQA